MQFYAMGSVTYHIKAKILVRGVFYFFHLRHSSYRNSRKIREINSVSRGSIEFGSGTSGFFIFVY